MRNLNHTDLINEVARESKKSPQTVDQVLRATFDVIGRHVVAGFRVNVSNFGTWYRSEVAARIRRNPATGEEYRAPRTQYPRFRYAPKFRNHTTSGEPLTTLKKLGH